MQIDVQFYAAEYFGANDIEIGATKTVTLTVTEPGEGKYPLLPLVTAITRDGVATNYPSAPEFSRLDGQFNGKKFDETIVGTISDIAPLAIMDTLPKRWQYGIFVAATPRDAAILTALASRDRDALNEVLASSVF